MLQEIQLIGRVRNSRLPIDFRNAALGERSVEASADIVDQLPARVGRVDFRRSSVNAIVARRSSGGLAFSSDSGCSMVILCQVESRRIALDANRLRPLPAHTPIPRSAPSGLHPR